MSRKRPNNWAIKLYLNPLLKQKFFRRNNISMYSVIPTTITLVAAKQLGATKASLVPYATSGDVSGDYSYVVGYAGFIIQ